MKKRILSVLICICMLLPFGTHFVFAEGRELTFSRYFSDAESDWEIYGGNTNLVVLVKGTEAAEIADSIDRGTLFWYLKTNGTTYRVDPGSYYLNPAKNSIILRFPTFSCGFCPSVNPIRQNGSDAGIYYDIDFSALDKDGNTVYYGSLDGLHSDITDPVVPNVGTLNGSRYGTGMRNYNGVTQITFTIKESIVQTLYDNRADYTWRLSISDGTLFHYMDAEPTSCDASNYLVTFEPCLAQAQFIPQKDVTYYINLELWQGDTLKYFAGSTIYGYRLEEDPILPGEKYNITFRVGDREETAQWYKGQMPSYKGDTSRPSGTPAYSYVFSGWEPKLEQVSKDAVYTAVYEKVDTTFNVTFITDTGSTTVPVVYGEIPVFEGDLGQNTVSGGKLRLFTGWDKEFEPATADAVYRAQYEEISAEDALTVKAEGGTLYRGTQRSFVISLANGKGLTSFSFDVVYDESRYTLKTATALLEGVQIDGSHITYEGKVLEKDVDLLALVLVAKEDGALGKAELTVSNERFYSGSQLRGVLVSAGILTLGETLSGDINKDACVTTDDADSLLSLIADKGNLPEDVGDTNHDGKIDIRDAVRICTYLQGDAKQIWSVYDDKLHTVTYTATKGGEVIGTTVQKLTRTQYSEAVVAATYANNYTFSGWSDGKTSAKRQDIGIEGDVTLTAVFEEKAIVLDLPEIHISTLQGASITSKTEYVNGTLTISGADDEDQNVTDLPLQIRGRGNYLWDVLKNVKPSYRIRLVNKASLLGYDAERDWVLLTTYSDVSMLRNYTTWRLGDVFDNLPHSVQGEFVTVYLNGDYRGVYLLCERIEASRLELEDEAETNDKDYLLELDNRAAGEGRENLDWFTVPGAQQPFVIKSQVDNTKQTAYIKAAVTVLHEALMSGDLNRISAIADIHSIVDSYIVNELGKNRDVGFASFYFYKKAGGLFYFTTPWDFDLGWGNDSRYPTTDGLVSTGTGGNIWFATLIKQDWFKKMVRNRMAEMSARIAAIGEEILATGEALTAAAKKDQLRWDTIGRRVFEEPESVYTLKDYEAHYRYFYEWYTERWVWLCDYFGVT